MAELSSKAISNCRRRVREYNNKINDARLEDTFDDVPCKYCRATILDEANGLNSECYRLMHHFQKDEMSSSLTAQNSCATCPKEDICDTVQDSTCIKEAMSSTRKLIRHCNDHLDDLKYEIEDGRPCERCRESVIKECQGLVHELQRAKDQYQESSIKDIYPCDYAIRCSEVKMRSGDRGRSHKNQQQHDSGFHSVDSEIIKRGPTESMDDTQTASAETTQPKELNKDIHIEAPSSSSDKPENKGPFVTLEVSMDSTTDDSNTTDA